MGLWKDKIRKDWCYSFEYQKESYAGRGFKTKRDASAFREERRKRVKEQAKLKPVAMGFKELAYQYLDHSQRKFVTDTYKRKVHVCKKFVESQGDILINLITPLHIHNFLKTLSTNNTYNEYREELSTVFNWIKKTYAIQLPFLVNPCVVVDRMPAKTKEKKIPTEEEILQLIMAAKPGDEREIILICLHTLGRIDEVLRLRWQDVDMDKRTVTLWTRKRRDGAYEADVLPMNQDLHDVLKRRWSERIQDNWVFYNKATGNRFMNRPKMMSSICKRAGLIPIGKGKRKIEKGNDKGKIEEINLYYGFHALRHFMASYLVDQEKVSTKAVSGLLRHKNLRTTEIYLHSIDESQRAATKQIEGKFTLLHVKPQPETATM
jgi:integrase